MAISPMGPLAPALQKGTTASAPAQGEVSIRDVVVPGAPPVATGIYSRQDAPALDTRAESHATASNLSFASRAVCGVLAGVMGALALTGCGRTPTPTPAPTTSTTQGQSAAEKRLAEAFDSAQKAVDSSKNGDSKKAADDVARNLTREIQQYAKETGKDAKAVAETVKGYAISHPAVSLTVLFAAGVTSGAVLEHYGVPSAVAGSAGEMLSSISESSSSGLTSITNWVKAHPFIAAAIGVGVAAVVGYLIYQAVTPETPAAVPTTPEAKQLVESLDALEKQAAANPQQSPEEINKTFMEKVSDYAKATGKSASEVASDVKAYMVAHPYVTASVVLASGVATGVLLQKAGVPEAIASAASGTVDAVKGGGVGSVVDAIKAHPVLSTAIGVGLAAGAGYVVYQHVNAS